MNSMLTMAMGCFNLLEHFWQRNSTSGDLSTMHPRAPLLVLKHTLALQGGTEASTLGPTPMQRFTRWALALSPQHMQKFIYSTCLVNYMITHCGNYLSSQISAPPLIIHSSLSPEEWGFCTTGNMRKSLHGFR